MSNKRRTQDDLIWLGPVNGRPPNRAARRAKRVTLGTNGMRRPLERLADNQIGYYADPLRGDDCFRAAIATATQIPVEQVPDPRLHARHNAGGDPDEISYESWLRIAQWADKRGLDLMLHETVPADRERWIGVCVDSAPPNDSNPFTDHCLVMSYGRAIFDPQAKAIVPPGMRLRRWRAADVTYGLSFDPRKKE